jgi:hypothetical protein
VIAAAIHPKRPCSSITVHVAGSLAMTLLGMASVAWIRALS